MSFNPKKVASKVFNTLSGKNYRAKRDAKEAAIIKAGFAAAKKDRAAKKAAATRAANKKKAARAPKKAA